VPAEVLPEYRIKARNTSVNSENAIHHDTVARQYGFGGGLVPGVTVYAYLTHSLVEAFGTPWLDRGTAAVRFLKPIFDGEAVLVTGLVTSREVSGLSATLTARTERGEDCALMSVTLPAGSPTPVNLATYHARPLPEERPAATREYLSGLTDLGTPVTVFDVDAATEYLDKVGDDLALYRGARARAPGVLPGPGQPRPLAQCPPGSVDPREKHGPPSGLGARRRDSLDPRPRALGLREEGA
jgi:hypothetical protein